MSPGLRVGTSQRLLDPGPEAGAVDGAVEDARRRDPIVAQGGQKGGGLPVPVRHRRHQPGALGAAAVAPRHAGGGPGLVDPQAWLADVLARINDLPQTRLHELLPWEWKAIREQAKAA